MKITESASQIIIDVMKKKGLNPKTVFLEIGDFNGDLGLGFTREPFGKVMKQGELNFVLSGKANLDGMTVDYGEINGKRGLIFLGEDYVNKNN